MRNIKEIENELLKEQNKIDQDKVDRAVAAFIGDEYKPNNKISSIKLKIERLKTEHKYVLAANNVDWRVEILRGILMPLAVSIIGTISTAIILFKFSFLK